MEMKMEGANLTMDQESEDGKINKEAFIGYKEDFLNRGLDLEDATQLASLLEKEDRVHKLPELQEIEKKRLLEKLAELKNKK